MGEIIASILIIPLVIILLFAVTVLFLDYLSPYIYYMKISDTARQYLVTMENSGGLTATEKDSLLDSLEDRGIRKEDVTIGTNPPVGDTVEYGYPISITITYNLHLKAVSITTDGVKISFGKNTHVFPVKVSKTGISKLVQ